MKLSSWETDDDDAIKEHFKWSLNFEYMKMVGCAMSTKADKCTIVWRIWNGSSNMMKPVDPKEFQTWRENRNYVM